MEKRLNVLLEVAIAISMAEEYEKKMDTLTMGTKSKSSKIDKLDEPFQGMVS